MRQAGRHLPEYRKLKETYDFWELVRTPELTLEVTMQPVRRYGVDAAILFSDIMTPLPPMGVNIEFKPGPVIENPVRTHDRVKALEVPGKDEIAPYVADAISLIRDKSEAPLIGFAGAPLTLAAYLVDGGGSKDYAHLRGFMRSQEEAAHLLMEKLADVTTRYLQMQIDAGVAAVQLFDSWAGLHPTSMYEKFGKPYVNRILDGLEGDVPRIYFAPHAGHLVDQFAELDCEALGADWRQSIASVRKQTGIGCVQGNLDPAVLFADEATVRSEVEAVLRDGLGGAHVFNFGHGMMKQTSPAKVQVAVDTVKEFDRTQ
jgi:uroporphyrinogen decarboxylase